MPCGLNELLHSHWIITSRKWIVCKVPLGWGLFYSPCGWMLMNTLLEIRNYSQIIRKHKKWANASNNLFAMNTLTGSTHTIGSCVANIMNSAWEMIWQTFLAFEIIIWSGLRFQFHKWPSFCQNQLQILLAPASATTNIANILDKSKWD